MRDILKKVRKERNMTQQELATAAGISRVHYTQIENSSHNKKPSYDVAIRIKKALDYVDDDLFLVSDVSNKNK